MSVFISIRSYYTKLLIFVAVAIVALSSLSIISTTVQAQQEQGGSGLSISPTRTELSLLPGASDVVTVSLRNITSGPIIAKVTIDDFEPDNETGEPRLIVDPDRKSKASISSFAKGVDDIRLEVGESKDIAIPVDVPPDAAPGGYYGAVRFQAIPVGEDQDQGEGNQVSLTANVLSLVLIEVPGDIEQKVAVNFAKAFIDENSGSVFTRKPNFVGVEIDNQGNSFVKPFGRVVVKDMRGNEVFDYELNNSNPRSNVLPESTRVFKDRLMNIEKKTVNGEESQDEISPITMPGRYSIEANVSYGNGGEVLTVTSTFWYLPPWFLIALVIVIALLVGVVYYFYRKYATKSVKRKW